MELKNKCDIIEEFMRDYVLRGESHSDDIDKFVSFNDLGIPLAQSMSYELATPTKNGEFLIEETWLAFCEVFDVDPYGDYEDLDDFFESQ